MWMLLSCYAMVNCMSTCTCTHGFDDFMTFVDVDYSVCFFCSVVLVCIDMYLLLSERPQFKSRFGVIYLNC